jgi:hypothetical protein
MIFFIRVDFAPSNQAVVGIIIDFMRNIVVTFSSRRTYEKPTSFSWAETQHWMPPYITQLAHRHAMQYRTEHCLSYIESQSVHSVTLGGGTVGVGGE